MRRAGMYLVLPLATGAYGREIEPFWLDVREIELHIPGLPRAFDGFRIAQLTDLHVDHHIPDGYLRRVIEHVKLARPDVTCVTGDIVNHTPAWIDYSVDLLSGLQSPLMVSFGNHDYCPGTSLPRGVTFLADLQQRALARIGCTVLRNQAVSIARGGEKLWFVGVEDLWTYLYSPRLAFAKVPKDALSICMSHNPDSAAEVATFGPRLILAGHTHGGQVRVPLLGAPVLPVNDRRYDQGLFRVGASQLYVSRGIGFLLRVRFFCRPELPIFTLRAA